MEGQSEHAGDGGGSRVVLHVGDNTEEQGTAAVLGKLPLKIACVGCRTIKAKCRLPNGEAPTGDAAQQASRCARCIRLKMPCEYKSAPRRGRKPKALLTLESATATATTSSRASVLSEGHPRPSHPVQHSAFSFPPPPPLTTSTPWCAPTAIPSTSSAPFASTSSARWDPPPPRLSPSAAYSPSHPYIPQLASSIPAPPFLSASTSNVAKSSPAGSNLSASQASPASTVNKEHSSLSLADAAEIKAAAFNRSLSLFSPRPRQKPLKQPDPVDLGLLSQWEAMALVEHFHSHLNPYIILLDKHLHTYEYVKSSSTVLFSAMLAASAKFFRSDLYSSLLLFAQQIVTRFMGGDGPQHVGLCQAILIQAYWKEPFDSSAWLKIGYAIRLGYQLGLHRNRKTPLPPDELEARVVVDAERTWVTLCCFDHSSCMTVDDDNEHEYSMITRHNIDIDSWLTETRHFDVSDDNEQGASIELIRVYSLCKNIANGTSKTAASTLASHVSSMLRAMQRKFLDADSPSFRLLSPQAAHKVRWHWRAASVALAKACIIAAGVDDQVVLADFLAKTAELVECFEELATEGLLRFFQDLTAVVLLGLGEFCGKLFSQVDQDVQTVLVGFLTRIYTAARRAKDGDENSVAGFISRFFKAVLTALRGETTPSSPGSGGGQADQLTGPFEQLEGLDLFNTDLDALVAELAHDNEYWKAFSSFLPFPRFFPVLNPSRTLANRSSISSAQANSSWAWLDAALLQPQDPPPPLSS